MSTKTIALAALGGTLAAIAFAWQFPEARRYRKMLSM